MTLFSPLYLDKYNILLRSYQPNHWQTIIHDASVNTVFQDNTLILLAKQCQYNAKETQFFWFRTGLGNVYIPMLSHPIDLLIHGRKRQFWNRFVKVLNTLEQQRICPYSFANKVWFRLSSSLQGAHFSKQHINRILEDEIT